VQHVRARAPKLRHATIPLIDYGASDMTKRRTPATRRTPRPVAHESALQAATPASASYPRAAAVPTSSEFAPARAADSPRALYACVAAGVLCFVLVGLHLAGRQSAAYDEVTDVGSGYALLHGNWRLDPEHLPLSKLLAALALPDTLPALTVPADDASAYARWVFGNKLLYGTSVQPLVLLRAARAPLIWLNALLIPVLACFTFRLGGKLAAGIAVGLASLEPLWLAHATLVGSDAVASLSLYATTWLAWLFVHGEAKQRRVMAAALCVSAALSVASKYYIPPALACVWLAALIDAQRVGKLRALGPALLATGGLAAVLGVCLAWGWPFGPARYLYGLQHLGETHIQGYDFYAFGDLFHTKHRLYLTQALAVKVSAAVLILSGVGLTLAVRRTVTREVAPTSTLLWLPALGHLVVMSLATPPMGVRYALPVLPFLFMQAGLAARALWQQPRARWVLPALACLQLWSFGDALRYSPLSFFNGLGCYSAQIPPCLDDSNVDWGHALPQLEELLRTRFASASVRISYFGSSPFTAYVPQARAMGQNEWAAPYRAIYAISLHSLARASASTWARTITPTAVVGGAYALFDLRDHAELRLPDATAAQRPPTVSSSR
jgi:hypothetical protein